jgi:hypothetical protein
MEARAALKIFMFSHLVAYEALTPVDFEESSYVNTISTQCKSFQLS